MNVKLSKILATILITAMIVSVIPAFAAPPYDADAIWIEPDTNYFDTGTTSVGDKFIVTVWMNISFNVTSWQVKMFYNPAHLNITQVDYTGVSKSLYAGAYPTYNPVPFHDYITGYVLVGEVALGGIGYIPPNCDSLFWVEFEIIAAPPKGGELSSWITIDNTSTTVEEYEGAFENPPTYNSEYKYTWATPPKPHLACDPAYVEYDQYTNATGEEFDIDLYVKSLETAWFLKNVTLSLAYNDTMLEVLNVVFDPLWGTTSLTPVAGDYGFEVKDPTSTPVGDVLIATITFTVTCQCEAPPYLPGDYEETALDIHDYELWDTSIPIPTNPEVDGLVKVYCLVTLQLPYLEVSSVTMGPDPCRGEEFNVTITLNNLDSHWYLIGLEFKLTYDDSLITPVEALEGPFLPEFAANQTGSLGTFFISHFDSYHPVGPHVLIGNMIFPNGSGMWNPPWPEGDGVIAIITFKVAYQSYGEANMTCPLEIYSQLSIGLDDPATQNVVPIPMDVPVDGEYWITTVLPGRVIDLYGGALNEGYGSWPFPAPYGGQGPDNPMDLVAPQSHMCFFAEVTYNWWPVQRKLVSFEVEYPDGRILLKLVAETDDDGIAYIEFQMPWPCEDPESLFGVWTVTTTVSISDVTIIDTLTFHYDYLVNIWKVTTDKFEYDHCEEVQITIEYGTHAQQFYPVLLSAVLMDELIVPDGIALLEVEVGGATYCTYTNFTETVSIHVLKWAFAGIATIHVNAFDKDPTVGGIAWCPEYTPAPEICIQPY